MTQCRPRRATVPLQAIQSTTSVSRRLSFAVTPAIGGFAGGTSEHVCVEAMMGERLAHRPVSWAEPRRLCLLCNAFLNQFE